MRALNSMQIKEHFGCTSCNWWAEMSPDRVLINSAWRVSRTRNKYSRTNALCHFNYRQPWPSFTSQKFYQLSVAERVDSLILLLDDMADKRLADKGKAEIGAGVGNSAKSEDESVVEDAVVEQFNDLLNSRDLTDDLNFN